MAADVPRSIVAQHSKKFALAWAALACLAVVVGVTLFDLGAGQPIIDEIKAQTQYRIIGPVVDVVRYSVLTPEVLIILGAGLVLQLLLPARPEEHTWSCNLFVDILYMFLSALTYTLLVDFYVSIFAVAHRALFNGFTLFRPDQLPFWAQVVIAFVLYDFLRYVQHVVKHKVPFLWQFHMVHHSQPQLTLFTTYRTHAMDLVVQMTITSIPFLFLGFSKPYIVGLTLFSIYYEQWYHSNVRLNLGPLHYLLITPQSHRIHHSSASEHADKNFGVILSIWDAMFGTRVWDTKVYPTTGVQDPDFPAERRASPLVALAMPIVQSLYPFEVLWKRYFGQAKPARIAGSAAE